MAGFTSAGAIEAGLTLPEDALGHSQVAQRLPWAVSQLSAGSVVSLQGSWGRGKTDVLARLVTAAQQSKVDRLWVNPWQYGTPDLLSPLVLALLDACCRRASSKGLRFSELVDALLEESGGQRRMICVDDLDRCLPDRLVALLQAMRFLISAGARATFVVALAPILARQALVTHYQTDAFDPDQYLDKMFTLRVSLPAVPHHRVAQNFHGHFARPPMGAEEPAIEALISASLEDGWASHIAEHASAALCTPTPQNLVAQRPAAAGVDAGSRLQGAAAVAAGPNRVTCPDRLARPGGVLARHACRASVRVARPAAAVAAALSADHRPIGRRPAWRGGPGQPPGALC